MTGISISTAIAANLTATLVMVAALIYLARLRGATPALGLWSLAYATQAARQGLSLLAANGQVELQPVAESCFTAFTVLLLAGTLRFLVQRVPTIPLVLGATAIVAWNAASAALGLSFLWQTLPVYLANGLVMLTTAAAFWVHRRRRRDAGYAAVAVLFALWGVHVMDYPFLRPVPWFAPVGFLLSSALTLAVAMALIILTQRRQQAQAEFAVRRAARTEAELRESEARFRTMADTMPALLYMTDTEGRCQFVNKTWLSFTGRNLGEELGEGWLSEVHPDDLRVVVDQEGAAFAARMMYVFTYRLRNAAGDWCWFIDHGAPRFAANGDFLGYIGTLVDVTEQRILAEQLQHAQKMEAVGQLTGGVAHDFNNLLAIILGNLDLLDERLPADSQLRVMVRDSLRAAERGAELTSRLLAFARRQPLKPEPTDVNQLVAGTIDLLRRTLGGTIRVDTVLAGNLGEVEVDPGQLESALLNLAINARDAMPQGGRLTLRTAAVTVSADNADRHGHVVPGDYIEILVADSGTGMAPEIAARAFEPFFTTKRVGQGSGLGLSMVYGFVTQSGGSVTMDSAPDRGTRVRLLLPLCLAEPREAPAPAPAPAGGGGEVILLVEDDPNVRQLAAQLLDQLGYRFVEAGDGPSALAVLASRSRVDLLFTDIMLPRGMNGIELARLARARREGLRVLYMSGYAEAALAEAAAGSVANMDLLHKPFRKTELASRIRRALDAPLPVDDDEAAAANSG